MTDCSSLVTESDIFLILLRFLNCCLWVKNDLKLCCVKKNPHKPHLMFDDFSKSEFNTKNYNKKRPQKLFMVCFFSYLSPNVSFTVSLSGLKEGLSHAPLLQLLVPNTELLLAG